MAKVKIIPRHEPEVIDSKARERDGDMEKVATTSFGEITFDRVRIVSRYSKADELEEMQAMILALPSPQRKSLNSIFCDSKAGHSYIATLRNWNEDEAWIIGKLFDEVAHKNSRGHNGICICADDGSILGDTAKRIDIGANWNGDLHE